jgi:hypothetical protein
MLLYCIYGPLPDSNIVPGTFFSLHLLRTIAAVPMTFPSKIGLNYADSITALTLTPLVWIFICIRIYVRGFLINRLGWDDVAAVFAVVSSHFTTQNIS